MWLHGSDNVGAFMLDPFYMPITRYFRLRCHSASEASGRKEAVPNRVTSLSMTASNRPPNGENVSEAEFDYQSVGEDLLAQRLESVGHDLLEEFNRVSSKADGGGCVDRDDWARLWHRLNEAEILLDTIEDGLADSPEEIGGE